MATKNLNTLPSGGAMQATDIILSNGFAASHLVTYMADETSSINNSSSFLIAPLSTGRAKARTGTQVKAYINGSTAVIIDTDLFVVTRAGVAYKVTALEVKTFAAVGGGGSLTAPANFTAVADSTTSIVLDWDAVAGATNYLLQRALNVGFTGVVTDIYSGALTTFTDIDLDTSTTYYYRVKAQDAGTPGTDSTYSTAFETPENFGFDILDPDLDWAVFQRYSDAGTITTSGSPVRLRTAADQSVGGTNDFSAAEADAPLYLASGGSNNKAYVEVDPSHIIEAPTSGIGTSPFSIYMVVKLPSLSDGDYVFYYNLVSGAGGAKISTAQLAMFLYTGAADLGYKKSGYTTNWIILQIFVKTSLEIYIRINKNPDFPITVGGDSSNIINYIRGNFANNKYSLIAAAPRIHTDTEKNNIVNAIASEFQILQNIEAMMCFGNSHLVGLGSTAGNSYIEQFGIAAGIEIYNYGVSGTTMKDYVVDQSGPNSLFDYYTIYNKTKYSELWVSFEYGTNDSAVHDGNGNTIATWKADYKAIIQSFLDAGFNPARIIICTPPYSTGSYVDGWLDEHYTAITEIASELGILLADFYAAMQAVPIDCGTIPGGDGIHMNQAAHDVCAATMIAAIP